MPWPDSVETAAGFLRTLGAPDRTALVAWLRARAPDQDWLRWLDAEGLAPYTFHRIRQVGPDGGILPGVLSALRERYYQNAGFAEVQRHELAHVLAALDAVGVESVLLKGAALAYTVYPDPACRPRGDLDLWVPPEQMDAAVAALQGAGYRPEARADRPAELVARIGGEQQMVGDAPSAGLVELQWPAWRGEWFRFTARTDYDAIRARCTALQVEGQAALVMAPEDMLVHVCVHAAINHQFGRPWLRGLLDVHLLLTVQPPDWETVVERLRSWRLATPVWTVLDLTRALFGAPMPAGLDAMLAPSAARRQAIQGLDFEAGMVNMRAAGYDHRRFLVQWLMAGDMRDAGRLTWHALFPDGDWLRARYGANTPAEIARARILHPLRLVTSARA
jgi:hypothetical protein